LRTLVFESGAVLILPRILGLNGVWLAIVVAEAFALVVSSALLIGNKKRYHYA